MTRYPIYVISKGRWEKPYTVNSLLAMGIKDFFVCVEPKEYESYKKALGSNNLLKLPEDFSEKGQGSIPVRNWVWEHSISNGDERHFLMDDNINGFERLNNNLRGRVHNDSMFRAMEDFVDRYENVAFASPEYRSMGGGSRRKKPPFKTNYRCYSCTLIKNDLKYRWRGRYNEDSDICLRALKDGWVTVTFYAFLQNKLASMTIKGGNTDSIYNTGDNRKEFAESLKRQHPDCVKVVQRYGRYHHDIDFSKFKVNEIILKEGVDPTKLTKVDNYGMVEVPND
jgi:hypothetical protein